MALTIEEKEILKGISTDQKEIMREQTVLHTVLLGANGAEGLVEEVRSIAKGYGKLKRNFWTLVGILIGSGIIGGSVAGLMSGG